MFSFLGKVFGNEKKEETVVNDVASKVKEKVNEIEIETPVTFDGDRQKGKVKWFNNSKGYGFITSDSGDDIFLHYSSIQVEGYRSAKEGQVVEFSVADGEKGPQAQDVVLV